VILIINGMATKQSKICVLASGGIESSALIYLLTKQYRQVFPVYISHGFIWENAEQYWLKKFIRSLKTPSVEPLTVYHYPLQKIYQNHWGFSGEKVPGFFSRDEAVFLLGRNLLLLSLASIFCYQNKIPRIALGILASNPFPDSSSHFFTSLERTFRMGYQTPLKIERPFSKLKKKDVICLAKGAPLELTFSCLKPRGRFHCGKCNKCAEREKAFRAASTGDG